MVTASSANASPAATAVRADAPAVTRGAATGSASDRAIVWVRTPGVRTHAATASLTRGASQMAASVTMKVSMQMVAAQATRLWG